MSGKKLVTRSALAKKKCLPCEGGAAPLSHREARALLRSLGAWRLAKDSRFIESEWLMKDFMAAVNWINRIARLAEKEGHHPDIHLTSYRKLKIRLSTHAIGGLSENDFILAAKIDRLKP